MSNSSLAIRFIFLITLAMPLLGASQCTAPPDSLKITITHKNPTCDGPNSGEIQIATTSNKQLQYSLKNGAFTNSTSFVNLTAATYTVFVKDGENIYCKEEIIAPLNVLRIVSKNKVDEKCSGDKDGRLDFSVLNEKGPCTVQLSRDGSQPRTLENDSTVSKLAPGQYKLTATCANSCPCEFLFEIIGTDRFIITKVDTTPVSGVGKSDGQILVKAQGGTSPYEYGLNSEAVMQTGMAFRNLASGNYMLYVKDSHGCADASPAIVGTKGGGTGRNIKEHRDKFLADVDKELADNNDALKAKRKTYRLIWIGGTLSGAAGLVLGILIPNDAKAAGLCSGVGALGTTLTSQLKIKTEIAKRCAFDKAISKERKDFFAKWGNGNLPGENEYISIDRLNEFTIDMNRINDKIDELKYQDKVEE